MYISIILVIVSIITPWNLAFVDDEILNHLVFDLIVDVSFLTDMILNFNTAFYKYNNERSQLVTNRS